MVYLRPGATRWRMGVSVPISERGRMGWSFRADEAEVNPPSPWLFRFAIRGHGKRDATEVFVLFGK